MKENCNENFKQIIENTTKNLYFHNKTLTYTKTTTKYSFTHTLTFI